MTEICKYSYDINDLLRENKWINNISLVNCIDNDTYYVINLKYNENKLELMTDFKSYCVVNNFEELSALNYDFLHLRNYSPKVILLTLDKYKINEIKTVDFSDEFNFYQTFKQVTKYELNYNELKTKSKKFSDNKNNTKKINVPKELLFNENQIYTILINEINKINTDYSYKHLIYPFENNIYDLRTKLFFDNDIVLELKITVDPKLYPFYPPKIEVVSPKLQIPLLLAIMNLNILKLENWNYTISFDWLITNIFNVLKPIINNYIDNNNKEITNIENLLIKLSNITKETVYNDINIDIKFNKAQIKNNTNGTDGKTYWKSGTGYGNDRASKWDIKNYILEKEMHEQELVNVLNEILKEINDQNINTISNSCLMKYLIDTTLGITLLSLESSKNIYEVVMKIIDGIYDFRSSLNNNFIKSIVTNLQNINTEIILLFENNEESKMNFLYQSLHNNYDKYFKIMPQENIQPVTTTVIDNTNKYEKYAEVMKPLQFGTAEVSDKHRFIADKKIKLESKAIVRVISELSTLKTSLPLNYESTIWMRVPKKDMNLFTFMISGPKDTPYENGLFIFHASFPASYPNVEPKVLIDTTGMGLVRFNPNLYANGKVCLSLLGTWSGEQGEKWNSKTSSFLQVLVSIQSLILVDQPYFNEPGYERDYGTERGKKLSDEYNEPLHFHTIELAMIDQIKNGPPEYKEVINQHFKLKKDDILATCQVWIDKSIKYKQKITEATQKLKELLDKL